MALSEKLVIEFQHIYKEETGKDVDLETARKYAEDIVDIFSVLAEIDRREKLDKLIKQE